MDLANILWVLNIEEEYTKLFSEMKNLIQRTIEILK